MSQGGIHPATKAEKKSSRFHSHASALVDVKISKSVGKVSTREVDFYVSG